MSLENNKGSFTSTTILFASMAVWISGSPLDAIIFPICWCEQDYEEFIHRRFVEGHVQELMSNIHTQSFSTLEPTYTLRGNVL